MTVLVGEAGTGKGVVLGAAREAWERDGHRVIGTAVAGAAAQRLGTEAGIAETMTDRRADRPRRTPAAQARLATLSSCSTRRGWRTRAASPDWSSSPTAADAKLVLAGDQAQLSPIGAGGLFAELKDNVPTARLTEVHRANHEWERDAWGRLRQGDAERALAAYQARGRLHLEETRAEAGERMVNDWAATRAAHPDERVVMITDASNHELDRLNKQAQQQRARRRRARERRTSSCPDGPTVCGSGTRSSSAPSTASPEKRGSRTARAARCRRATSATATCVSAREEPKPRDVEVATREFDGLRLAYAQHVYKAQGLTTDRSLVLTGGWQTDRETAYVALTRAREQTDIYTAAKTSATPGIDADAIERLAERANRSNAQQASFTRAEADEPQRSQASEPSFGDRLQAALDHQPDPASDRSHDDSTRP